MVLLLSVLLLVAINYAALRYPFGKVILVLAVLINGSGLIWQNAVDDRFAVLVTFLLCCILLVSMMTISLKKEIRAKKMEEK